MFPLLAAEKLRSQLTIFSNLYETQSEPQHNIGHMHKLFFEAYKAGDIDGYRASLDTLGVLAVDTSGSLFHGLFPVIS